MAISCDIKTALYLTDRLSVLDAREVRIIQSNLQKCVSLDLSGKKLARMDEQTRRIAMLNGNSCVCRSKLASGKKGKVHFHQVVSRMQTVTEIKNQNSTISSVNFELAFGRKEADALVDSGKKEVRDLLARRPFSKNDRQKNIRTALLVGAVMGGIVITGSLLGAGGVLAAAKFAPAAMPVIVQALQFSVDVGAHIAQNAPEALEVFVQMTNAAVEHASSLASDASQAVRSGADFISNSLSPAAIWISAQRAEIVMAAQSAFDMVSSVWQKALEMDLSKGIVTVVTGLGIAKGSFEAIKWTAEILGKIANRVTGRKPETSVTKDAARIEQHIHHHHHYHHPSDASVKDVENTAEKKASEELDMADNAHQNNGP